MTFYEKKLQQLHRTLYKNQGQIKAIIAVKNDIDRHYAATMNLNALSQEHCISKYHLLRLFKRYYGLTPRQYLIDRRIAASKALLSDGRSVTEACFAVGFESLGSFSTLFKRKTGKTPTQYRKAQLSRSNSSADRSSLEET